MVTTITTDVCDACRNEILTITMVITMTSPITIKLGCDHDEDENADMTMILMAIINMIRMIIVALEIVAVFVEGVLTTNNP